MRERIHFANRSLAMGIAYVLSQQVDLGVEHPVTYGSRKLLTREKNYSTRYRGADIEVQYRGADIEVQI